MKTQAKRKTNGQMCYTTGLIFVPIVLAIGAFAVDSMHIISAQHELQCSVDAAALAGAMKMNEMDAAHTSEYAIKVAAANTVDAVRVTNGTNGTVRADVVSPSNATSGSVTVTATRKISLLFGRLFSHATNTIYASATAGGSGQASGIPAGVLFPLAISVDAGSGSSGSASNGNNGNNGNVPNGNAYGYGNGNGNGNGNNGSGNANSSDGTTTALKNLTPGQQFTIRLDSGDARNAAFTSFLDNSGSGAYIKSAMDESLGLSNPSPPVVPSIEAGNSISLTNGMGPFQYLSGDPEYGTMLTRPFVLFPLIEGSAPFNDSRPVKGFVAIKITRIDKMNGTFSLVGIIQKPAIRGTASPSATSAGDGLSNLAPSAVKLIR